MDTVWILLHLCLGSLSCCLMNLLAVKFFLDVTLWILCISISFNKISNTTSLNTAPNLDRPSILFTIEEMIENKNFQMWIMMRLQYTVDESAEGPDASQVFAGFVSGS